MKKVNIAILICIFALIYLPAKSIACEAAFSYSALKDQGFEKGYIKGLDEVNQGWLPLAKKLREGKFDPDKTHVEYFANQISKHIEFIVNYLGINERVQKIKASHIKTIKEHTEELESLTRMEEYQDWIKENPQDKWQLQLAWLSRKEEIEREMDNLDELEGYPYSYSNKELFKELTYDKYDFYPNRHFSEYSENNKARDEEIVEFIEAIGPKGLPGLDTNPTNNDFIPSLRIFFQYPQMGPLIYLRRLAQLKKYTDALVNDRAFTYKEWIYFNVVLVSTSDPDSEMFYGDHPKLHENSSSFFRQNSDISTLVQLAPHVILIPTLIGELGIMAINKAGLHNVYALGIGTNKSFKDVKSFFEHDAEHVEEIVRKTQKNPIPQAFRHQWMEKVAGLPVQTRKGIEYAYFLLTYETATPFINKSPKNLKEALFKTIVEDITGGDNTVGSMLMKFSDKLPQQARQIEEIVDNFINLFIQIKKSKNSAVPKYNTEDFARIYNQADIIYGKDEYTSVDFLL